MIFSLLFSKDFFMIEKSGAAGNEPCCLIRRCPKNGARDLESRQKPGEMCDFCLPGSPKSARAASKVEQNLQNLEKCSTQLPSPEPCGLRLRANLKNRRLSVTEVRCSG